MKNRWFYHWVNACAPTTGKRRVYVCATAGDITGSSIITAAVIGSCRCRFDRWFTPVPLHVLLPLKKAELYAVYFRVHWSVQQPIAQTVALPELILLPMSRCLLYPTNFTAVPQPLSLCVGSTHKLSGAPTIAPCGGTAGSHRIMRTSVSCACNRN